MPDNKTHRPILRTNNKNKYYCYDYDFNLQWCTRPAAGLPITHIDNTNNSLLYKITIIIVRDENG